MATQLEIVNNILEELREDTVTSVADSAYSKLIARFVQRAIQDMEDINWTWSVYETEITTSITADGDVTYPLASTNARSTLIRAGNDRVPLAYDVTADGQRQLYDVPLKVVRELNALDDSTPSTSAAPDVFALYMDTATNTWAFRLLYGSTTARTWKSYWYVPQATLARDGSDDTTEILLPSRPVELRALYYALNERGEEMGEPGGIAWEASKAAIGAALELDMQTQQRSEGLDITNSERI